MSNFIAKTKHPKTGKWEMAEWLDDYYGHHRYAVRFPDGSLFDPSRKKMEMKEGNNKSMAKTNKSKKDKYSHLSIHELFRLLRSEDRWALNSSIASCAIEGILLDENGIRKLILEMLEGV